MLTYLRNRFAVASLKLRYERLVHERLLELTEHGSHAVNEDPGHWQQVGSEGRGLSADEAADIRTRAREFVQSHPHARHILRLMEAYVAGPELAVAARLIPSSAEARMALKSMRRTTGGSSLSNGTIVITRSANTPGGLGATARRFCASSASSTARRASGSSIPNGSARHANRPIRKG